MVTHATRSYAPGCYTIAAQPSPSPLNETKSFVDTTEYIGKTTPMQRHACS